MICILDLRGRLRRNRQSVDAKYGAKQEEVKRVFNERAISKAVGERVKG